MKKYIILASIAIFAFTMNPVFAASFSLFGDASVVSGGNPGSAAQIRSDASIAPNYGGVSVSLISPIPWSSLSTLSVDYNVTNDNCGGGSPRLTLGIDTNNDGIVDGNTHIAIGPSPSFTGCVAGWQSTGNLIGNTDAGRYDFSQFGGSTFTTYANAPANVVNGTIVKISVVVDGYWSAAASGGDSEQTVLIDNITANNTVVTFEPTSKDDCKKDGWKNFGTFKNQGDCVSFVATGGKNLPAGQ